MSRTGDQVEGLREHPEHEPGRAGSSRQAGVLRSDAERNRQRILVAARRLYAHEGLAVSMAALAREAGVGKATLFRHFASAQDLVDAVFADRMEAYVHASEQALADADPWHGFVHYVSAVCRMQAEDRGFADVLTLTLRSGGRLEQRRDAAYRGFLELIARAKATGHLRADFVSEDLVLVLMANAGVLSATATHAPDSWSRLVGQLLRGFASPGAPLPPLPAAPDSSQLYQAMAEGLHRVITRPMTS